MPARLVAAIIQLSYYPTLRLPTLQHIHCDQQHLYETVKIIFFLKIIDEKNISKSYLRFQKYFF